MCGSADEYIGPPPRPSLVRIDNYEPSYRSEHVSYTYPDGPQALRYVSLTIPAGQFVALVGANGSGKSTLLRHLIGLLRPDSGKVIVYGLDATTMNVGNWPGTSASRSSSRSSSYSARQCEKKWLLVRATWVCGAWNSMSGSARHLISSGLRIYPSIHLPC